MSFIDLHTNVSLGHTKITGLGGEKLWLCPTLGGDKLDISGNGNHGTYNGGMGTVADTSEGGSRAYSFDGTDDYIQRNGDVCPSQIRSYSCWVKLDTIQSQSFISSVEVTGSGTSQHKIALGLNGSGNFVCNFQDGGNTATATSTTTASPGVWYHVAATFNTSSGHDIEIFVDGNSVATGSGSGTLASINRIVIGATQRKSGQVINQFDGIIDDVRIFDRISTTTEITHLATKRGVLGSPKNPVIKKRRIFYAPTAPVTTTAKAVVLKKPKPSFSTGYAKNASESANPNLWKGLVGAWMPSFGVTGGTLKDVSGNGNDGTLTNMDAASDWIGTKYGGGLRFTGTSMSGDFRPTQNYVSIGYDFGIMQDISASFWIKPNSLVKRGICANDVPTNPKFAITLLADGRLEVYRGSNTQSTQSLEVDKWQHVLVESVDGVTSYYFNARFDRSQSQSVGASAGNAFVIGANYWGGVEADITNFTIHNRALSPAEIKQLYLNPSAPFERKQQTVGISTAQAFNMYWGNQATQLAGTLQ